jgi:hypothetical protein
MKLINREMQVALDALQMLKYAYPLRLPLQTIATRMDESPTFLKQALGKLSKHKYITGRRAQPGGYMYYPGTDKRSVANFLATFNRQYTKNPTKELGAASEKLARNIHGYLTAHTLGDIL